MLCVINLIGDFKVKKFLTIFACVLSAVLLLCACGAKEPEPDKTNDPAIVGTWKENYFDSGYIFKADATGTDTFWDLTFTYTAYDGELTLIYDDELWGASQYDYTVTGNKLSMTRKDTEETEQFEYEKVNESATTAPAAETESAAEGEGESESN